jgi:hypothetical protein
MLGVADMAHWITITSFVVLVQACAERPWITEARTGSLANLKRYTEVASARHQFDEKAIERLAAAVAEREIATADDQDAYQRVLGLRPCVSELYSSLRRQSRKRNDTAAAANLLLLDAGWMDSDQRLRSFGDDTDGAWRAVTVRASQGQSMRPRVHRALLDPDSRVRHAAIMAIRANPMTGDGGALFEVVRLDPDDSLRTFAMATLGETGDQQSMLLARDLWDAMDESLRLAFLQALALPEMSKPLGFEVLSRVMQLDDAMTGLVAASLLYRSESRFSRSALGRLVHSLHSGTSSEQLLVLATLGMREADLLPDIIRLTREGVPFVRVAALGLLIKSGRDLATCRQRLQSIGTSRDVDADEANRVLAQQGNESAIGRLEKRLTGVLASERMAAARVLVNLKRWDAVASALADDHPAVRLSTACQVLSAH